MIKGKIRKKLDKEEILNKITEYDIYRFYLGRDFKIGEALHSPFRKDDNPSFSVKVTRSGTLHHIDFADTSKSGNCFHLVEQLFNLDYFEAFAKIDKDFGLGIYNGEIKDYPIEPKYPMYDGDQTYYFLNECELID